MTMQELNPTLGIISIALVYCDQCGTVFVKSVATVDNMFLKHYCKR